MLCRSLSWVIWPLHRHSEIIMSFNQITKMQIMLERSKIDTQNICCWDVSSILRICFSSLLMTSEALQWLHRNPITVRYLGPEAIWQNTTLHDLTGFNKRLSSLVSATIIFLDHKSHNLPITETLSPFSSTRHHSLHDVFVWKASSIFRIYWWHLWCYRYTAGIIKDRSTIQIWILNSNSCNITQIS